MTAAVRLHFRNFPTVEKSIEVLDTSTLEDSWEWHARLNWARHADGTTLHRNSRPKVPIHDGFGPENLCSRDFPKGPVRRADPANTAEAGHHRLLAHTSLTLTHRHMGKTSQHKHKLAKHRQVMVEPGPNLAECYITAKLGSKPA